MSAPDEGWAAAGDVTLYDRQELVARLGDPVRPGDTDLALLVRALRRFGPEALANAPGDFAFVLWDWRRRRVQAVRDHFGVRPLVYRLRPDGIEIGSSPAQLLALDERDHAIDPVMVLQYLSNRYDRPGHTFFANIAAVRPACCLEAGPGIAFQSAYWQPSFQTFPGTYAELLEEWRRRFRASVRGRLRSHRPVGAYLSGGFDSSSVVGAAHELLEAGEPHAGRPLALSASFPGFSCDEGHYIRPVLARCTSFDSYAWDAREPNPDDFDDPDVSAPGLGQGVGRSRRRENEALRQRDARVVLTGDGGDALGFGYGALADLLANGRLRTLAQELASFRGWRRIRSIVSVEAECLRPPESRVSVPPWAGPALVEVVRQGLGQLRPTWRGPTWVQARTAEALMRPLSSYVVDLIVAAGARAGFQVRAPYLDIRLVEFVLGIPWQQRLPHGDLRRLQREAVAPFLPSEVNARRGKAGFDALLPVQVRGNLDRIQTLFRDRNWRAEPFVNQSVAREELESLTNGRTGPSDYSTWRRVWRVAVLEAWLRRVFEYSASPCAKLT